MLFPHECVTPDDGGARRDRTDDLMLAKHALSQLSYGPNLSVRLRPLGSGVTDRHRGALAHGLAQP
jgi:hypothetical protein